MIRTVVVDDEKHSLNRLKRFIAEAAELKLIADYKDPEVCFTELKAKEVRPELIFLDIELMAYCGGLELAKRIKKINLYTHIVFISAKKNHAVEAFDLNALDYLLKPVSRERFEETIARLGGDKV
ncbi:MAG: LytR/AlgR family response regulator transcription factor [Halanaerobium sp.]